MKSEYEVNINIKAKFESENPYQEKEVVTLYLHTIIQRNIESIEREIVNISDSKGAENDDYLKSLLEEKKILQSLINENFKIDVEKLTKRTHLKVVK